jgi:hypothetical protein
MPSSRSERKKSNYPSNFLPAVLFLFSLQLGGCTAEPAEMRNIPSGLHSLLDFQKKNEVDALLRLCHALSPLPTLLYRFNFILVRGCRL